MTELEVSSGNGGTHTVVRKCVVLFSQYRVRDCRRCDDGLVVTQHLSYFLQGYTHVMQGETEINELVCCRSLPQQILIHMWLSPLLVVYKRTNQWVSGSPSGVCQLLPCQ